MSVDMNIVIFGGRLTDDPTVLGNNVGCKFDVASNRTYKDKAGDKKEDPTYMPVTCWGQLGVLVMQRASKGSQVIVEGRLETRRFEGKDGVMRKIVGIVANDVRFADAHRRDYPESTPEVTTKLAPPVYQGKSPSDTDNTFQKSGASLPEGVTEEGARILNQILNNR